MLFALATLYWILCPTTGMHHLGAGTQHPPGSAIGCSEVASVPLWFCLTNSQQPLSHLLSYPGNPQLQTF